MIMNPFTISFAIQDQLSREFDTLGGCAFAYIPPQKAANKMGWILRNYDFGQPFDKISQRLIIAVLHPDDGSQSSAILSMPGQIYCPTCINENGLFMELNNGMPSGKQNRILLAVLKFI